MLRLEMPCCQQCFGHGMFSDWHARVRVHLCVHVEFHQVKKTLHIQSLKGSNHRPCSLEGELVAMASHLAVIHFIIHEKLLSILP